MEKYKSSSISGNGGSGINLSIGFGLHILGGTVMTCILTFRGNLQSKNVTFFWSSELQLQVKIVEVSKVLTIVLSCIILQCDILLRRPSP